MSLTRKYTFLTYVLLALAYAVMCTGAYINDKLVFMLSFIPLIGACVTLLMAEAAAHRNRSYY